MILQLIGKAKRGIKRLVAPDAAKRDAEMQYWRQKQREENQLSHDHYSYFYTDFFKLTLDDYTDMCVLDIGCGPRGSLEWATTAKQRVGLDPLVDSYRELGIDQHAMTYVNSGSEDIPFDDGHFDIVCSFNSLDHVDDLDATIREIKRVVRPGGYFLLCVEVNHPPTATEPITLGWDVADRFTDVFDVLWSARYENEKCGMYDVLKNNRIYDESNPADRPGFVCVKFRKRA